MPTTIPAYIEYTNVNEVASPENETNDDESNTQDSAVYSSTPTPTQTPFLTPAPNIVDKETTNLNTTLITPTKIIKKSEVTNMKVHFIDVGQGDSILIESHGHYMLIDAGENNKGTMVVNYLKTQGVKILDYIIGTHPHSDHIGGLDTAINSFTVGKVILPDVTHNTATFEDVLDAISDNNLKITKAVVGNTYSLGSASFTVISPNGSSYSNLNNYSVGIKLTNGDNSFILAGDAEELSEKEILRNGIDLSADVIKLGHHGSSTSSHSNFLDTVTPSYSVISVGTGNQYDHPNSETIQAMVDRNIKVFRTDKQGTIIFTSDGDSITVNTKAYKITSSDLEDTTQNEPSTQVTNNEPTPKPSGIISTGKTIVHITETGSKYHVVGCRYLKTDIEISLEEALVKGLKPCKTCKPPTK